MALASISCKICDRGILESKRTYRMSGPAVVIGHILLIPSIAGMGICTALFIATLFPTRMRSSARDQAVAEMQAHGVRKSIIRKVLSDPTYFPQKEVALDEGAAWVIDAQNKIIDAEIGSAPLSVMQRAGERAAAIMEEANVPGPIIIKVLSHPSLDADDEMDDDQSMVQIGAIQDAQVVMRSAALHSKEVDNVPSGFKFAGRTILFFAAIAAFVGGLLGWLLVMKKRVLQCSTCNAVVNAS